MPWWDMGVLRTSHGPLGPEDFPWSPWNVLTGLRISEGKLAVAVKHILIVSKFLSR